MVENNVQAVTFTVERFLKQKIANLETTSLKSVFVCFLSVALSYCLVGPGSDKKVSNSIS